jgi:hypothetical protein
MEDIDRLGLPQIKLETLEIWIHGRQFPDRVDYLDGNWLIATARCKAPGAEIIASGPIIRLQEIDRWQAELACLQETLSGKAVLACMEQNLLVELIAEKLGRLKMKVKITPDPVSQQHSFKFEIDQTYLRPLLIECRSILEEYPLRTEMPPTQ